MSDHTAPTEYASRKPFAPGPFDALAVYCSDGRYADQVGDFLHDGLRLERVDLMVIPGGSACLAGHFAGYRLDEAVFEQIRFLIEAHELRRVILIAHHDCGFYHHQLHIGMDQMLARQCVDLAKAADRIRTIDSRLTVDTYVEQLDGDTVRFRPSAKPQPAD
jgi:hypothetical protein